MTNILDFGDNYMHSITKIEIGFWKRGIIIDLLTEYEGNICIVGPEGEDVVWGHRPRVAFFLSGPKVICCPNASQNLFC